MPEFGLRVQDLGSRYINPNLAKDAACPWSGRSMTGMSRANVYLSLRTNNRFAEHDPYPIVVGDE
jgi:hypothetical protein